MLLRGVAFDGDAFALGVVHLEREAGELWISFGRYHLGRDLKTALDLQQVRRQLMHLQQVCAEIIFRVEIRDQATCVSSRG